jgi:two-component system response regulator HydG
VPLDPSSLSRATASGIVALERNAAAVVDARHCIVAANDAFREALGGGGEVVGRRCHEVGHRRRHPCRAASAQCPLGLARTTGAGRAVHIHETDRGPTPTLVQVRRAGDSWYLLVLEPVRGVSALPDPGRLVGRSPAFMRMLLQISRAARGSAPVCFVGAAGTGKHRVARVLHTMSSRSRGPFVSVDCASLDETQGAVQLFGSGASPAAGLVSESEGGSLYLRSVEVLPSSLQGPLVRLGENRLFLPQHAPYPRRVDVRLLAGSSTEPRELARTGRLRAELAALLEIFPIGVPALSRRRDDVPLLAQTVLRELSGERSLELSPACAAALRRRMYAENTRELVDVVTRAWTDSRGDPVTLERLICRERPTP